MRSEQAADRWWWSRPASSVVVGILVVAVLLTGVASVRWWTHPRVFEDSAGGVDFVASPLPVDKAILSTSITFPREGHSAQRVTFTRVSAHLVHGGVAARVTLGICRPRGEQFMTATGSLTRYCTSVRPLRHGSRMTLLPRQGGEFVFATIRATRPGRVLLDHVDLSYSLGSDGFFRRGTERVQMHVVLRATA